MAALSTIRLGVIVALLTLLGVSTTASATDPVFIVFSDGVIGLCTPWITDKRIGPGPYNGGIVIWYPSNGGSGGVGYAHGCNDG